MNLQNMIRSALKWVPQGWLTSGAILCYLVLQIFVTLGKVTLEQAGTVEGYLIGVLGIGIIRKQPSSGQ